MGGADGVAPRVRGGGPGPGRCHSGWRWAGEGPGARCHGRRAEFPHPRSDFLVFRGNEPAPPLYPVHIPYTWAMGRSAQSCLGSVLSLSWANFFSFSRQSGGPGLAAFPRVRHTSDTLFGKMRAVGNARRKWVSAPPARHWGLPLGFRTLWVTNERFGMLILTIGPGMLWNEDRGLPFV